MGKATQETFNVTVVTEPNCDVPGIIRFRKWIKSAKRVYALKVVSYRAENGAAVPLPPASPDPQTTEPPF